MKRRGELLDTLVFLIVAFLLPAWLLGHLYLTFFPARLTTDGAGVTETSLVAGDSTTAESPSAIDVSGSQSKNSEGAMAGDPMSVADRAADDTTSVAARALEAAQKKFDELNAKFQSQTTQGASLRAEVSQLQSELRQLRESRGQSDQTIRKLEGQVADARMKLEQAAQEKPPQVAPMNQDVQRLESELADARRDNQTLNQQMTAATESKQMLDEQIKKLEQEIKQYSEENANLKQVAQKAQENAGSAGSDMTKLTKLQQQLDGLNTQLADANNQITLKDAELNRLKLAAANAVAAPEKANGEFKVTPRSSLQELVYRDFISDKGKVAKLAFVRWEGDKVVVRSFADKRLYRLPITMFSASDQQYLREQ